MRKGGMRVGGAIELAFGIVAVLWALMSGWFIR